MVFFTEKANFSLALATVCSIFTIKVFNISFGFIWYILPLPNLSDSVYQIQYIKTSKAFLIALTAASTLITSFEFPDTNFIIF